MPVASFVGRRSVRPPAAGGGGGQADVRDSTLTIVSGTSISPTLPTYQQNDGLVLFVGGYAPSISTPSGYTQQASFLVTTPFGTDAALVKMYTKIAGASESSPTMTQTTSDQIGAALIACSNVNTSSLIDGTVQVNEGAEPNEPLAPAVSPTASNSLLLCFAAIYPSAGGGSSLPPSGMTEIEDGQSWDFYTAAKQVLTASGSTGTKQFDITGPSVYGWGTISVAIKSAP